jgi:carbon monoxide dehydrogenase subunit G
VRGVSALARTIFHFYTGGSLSGAIMFKTIGLILVLAVAVILLLALTKPSSFRVERSTTIAAPPEKISAVIDDFHQWNAWSPWAKLDPNMKATYSGPPSGVGSVYEWEGNSKVGKGRMEILSVDPTKTTIKLDFLKPFEGHNTADFVLEPQGSDTRVNWIMNGPMNFFPGKLMSVFTTMDKMIGPDFDKGLANLKAAAEHQ